MYLKRLLLHTRIHFFCSVINIFSSPPFLPPSLLSKYFRTIDLFDTHGIIESKDTIFRETRSATIDIAYFFLFLSHAWHDRERMRGQMTALPAFETLLTLRILARRARLTPLYPVENDDITIKLPSAYGN